MGGSSSQTVGYKYFAGLQVVLGNCIEQILNINPDNRGWILSDKTSQDILKEGDVSISFDKTNLFGGDKAEGGWAGTIDIHTGRPENLRQNEYLAEHDSDLVSSFPYLSYLVFRGDSLDKGFHLVSMSGMLKEVLYWPKRTRIKDDGSEQWFKLTATETLSIIVCEIFARVHSIFDESRIGTAADSVVNWIEYLNNVAGENQETFISKEIVRDGIISQGSGGKVWYGSLDRDVYKSASTFVSMQVLSDLKGIVDIEVTIMTYGEKTTVDVSGFSVEEVEKNLAPNGYENHIVIRGLASVGAKISVKSTATGVITVNPVTPTDYLGNTVDIVSKNIRSGDYSEESYPDINPIHQIREIITNDTAMNKPESMINDNNFKSAATRIWEEGLGVSGAFTEKSCKEAIDELLYHIEAGIRVNRQTGLYEIILFRDDLLDLDNAQLFDESNIKSESFNIETANIDDVINSVNVNYYDRDNIKDSSFSLDELGSILSNQPNAETLDFPYFMNRRNAELVGNWKLKQLSTPTRKGSFKTGKYDARKINRYDVVKLTWHNQNMIEVPIRIMKIGLGDGRDNTVTLDWVEVIPYSSTVFPTINVDPPTSVVLPPQPNQSIAFEMPYFEAVQRFGQTQVDAELANNPDLGYLVVATKKPQNNSINALLYTDSGTGYQQASIVDYCPVATLDQTIGYLDTTFAVKNVANISQAEVGTLILCEDELMVYQGYDPETKVLTVKRAALDTHPKPHSQDAVFYFYDAFNAFDTEQYVLSEVINSKVLTTTPSGIQDLASAPVLSLEINARPIRPYPPANIKLNDVYFPQSIVVSNDVVVTWVDRNRIQQTGGSILGWTEGGVAKETGVTYSIELSSEGVVLDEASSIGGTTHTFESSLLIPNKPHKIKLWSLRDGYESLKIFEHSFFGESVSLILAATVDANEVVGSTVPDANITVNVDESLTANMKFDGSSISGTAEAGATITIEVEE
ncbi:phage tail protein [Acinetobacter venetianus]|uniref:phage tail protein n=1 Tax=Acinetobacter venetianus TaxID=52133 RepID=UPI00241BF0B8|nr:phage tail protein [Acinetobacter venetianus]